MHLVLPRLLKPARAKNSRFLQTQIYYDRKKFYNIGPDVVVDAAKSAVTLLFHSDLDKNVIFLLVDHFNQIKYTHSSFGRSGKLQA